MKDRVAAVETPDPQHVRFKLKAAVARLPHLLLQRHRRRLDRAQEVRREGRRRRASRKRRSAPAPTSSSPSRPGVELALEAFDQYWRKKPSVKRLVFKVIPDESTRLAALKRGEVDIAYSIRGELAEEVCSAPGAHAEADGHPGAHSGSTSPISGTRNRRGMISACGRRPAWRSTARPSTRR